MISQKCAKCGAVIDIRVPTSLCTDCQKKKTQEQKEEQNSGWGNMTGFDIENLCDMED